jgi:hypothetical protein
MFVEMAAAAGDVNNNSNTVEMKRRPGVGLSRAASGAAPKGRERGLGF